MPLPPGSRRGRRLVGGLVGAVVVSLACTLPVSAYADGDDYPYAGLGKCPLVPLPPKAPGTQNAPGKPGGPAKPGPNQPGQDKPGNDKPGSDKPGKPGENKPDRPPPPRQCAKHIWFYNGSYGDPWGFALRNCTSFVAWRLRMTNGLTDFENHFGGIHWGNAAHWDRAATELGYLVDDVPAVGAVAQTDHGSVGHVAWVESVGDGTVTVEEYNYGVAGGYDVRTVPTSSFRYLHLQDLAPAPNLGSTRAGVATTDAHGGSWSAHTTAAGDLVVRRPSGRATHLTAPQGWSPDAAPSMLTDAQGRIWVAAVTRSGRVLTAHTTSASTAFSRPRAALSGSTTSSPTLAVDGQGRVRLLAVDGRGTLLERHAVGAHFDRWSRSHRLGAPASWSTQAAPVATTDLEGRLWLAAVTRRGHLLTQHSTKDGRGWTGFHAVDRRRWSVTSTPALADAADGRLWLASVDERGHLVVRHTRTGRDRWLAGERQPGVWSPYSSPSMSFDKTGRTWLAAIGDDGDLTVLWQPAGATRWRSSRGLPDVPASETASATLTSTVDGVLVGVTDGHGGLIWRRPLGQAGTSVARGPRSGGLSISPFL